MTELGAALLGEKTTKKKIRDLSAWNLFRGSFCEKKLKSKIY